MQGKINRLLGLAEQLGNATQGLKNLAAELENSTPSSESETLKATGWTREETQPPLTIESGEDEAQESSPPSWFLQWRNIVESRLSYLDQLELRLRERVAALEAGPPSQPTTSQLRCCRTCGQLMVASLDTDKTLTPTT
jgi:hypothetical protein